MGFFRGLVIGTKVAFKATGMIVKGTAKTVQTAVQLTNAVANGDAVGATRIVGNKIAGMTVAGCATAKNIGDLLDEVDKCSNDKSHQFLTKDNEQKLIACASIGTAFIAGSCIAATDPTDIQDLENNDSDISDNDDGGDEDTSFVQFDTHGDLVCPVHGVDCDAIFNRSDDDLSDLIGQGENQGTEHLTTDEIHRSIAVRNAFLHEHGYDSIPSGYEVHHITPLSEGGADSEENLILIDEKSHDKITAAHRNFYGWNK